MVKVYLVPKRLSAQMGRQLALKQEARGPFIAHLITTVNSSVSKRTTRMTGFK